MKNRETFRLLASWLILLATLPVIAGCEPSAKNNSGGSAATETGKVTLSIDFGNRRTAKQFQLPCYEGSTVLSILERAHHDGQAKVARRGTAATAFVTAIDGIENQGANGDNWVYRVNDQLGDQSCGLFEIKPGDRIDWTLGQYQDEDQ